MLIRSTFMFRVPRSDRTLMSTRSKPLPVHVDCRRRCTCFSTTSNDVSRAIYVQYLGSKTRTRKSKHVSRSGMSRATTLILGGRASDGVRDRQVFLHFPHERTSPALYIRYSICDSMTLSFAFWSALGVGLIICYSYSTHTTMFGMLVSLGVRDS